MTSLIPTGTPLPHGPDETHLGRTVRRQNLGEVLVGVVTEVDPFGGWVRLDDGTFRRADAGRWELLP